MSRPGPARAGPQTSQSAFCNGCVSCVYIEHCVCVVCLRLWRSAIFVVKIRKRTHLLSGVEWLVRSTMPNSCCVTGCRSGGKSNDEKVSLFRFPSDPKRREQWKCALFRGQVGGFSLGSPHVRVCEKHFDPADIVRHDERIVNGDIVTLWRTKPKLNPDAVPKPSNVLQGFSSKSKARSRPPGKRRRVAADACGAADAEDNSRPSTDETAGVANSGGEQNTRLTVNKACQTISPLQNCELEELKSELRSTKRKLRHCQQKLAKVTAHANELSQFVDCFQKLSDTEKLILDQCLMKAHAKSTKDARCSPA
ncbi:uncharacterized protein LOC144100769 isoform X1 [Amblyomma americanum]